MKRFAYCWLTDFVGWLPTPEGGGREASLTADYNAEIIEHIARHPRVRDLAMFVGNPDDIVPDRFGADLPSIRDWTIDHYSFPGYITGFDPNRVADRELIRHELGYGPDERACVVTWEALASGHHSSDDSSTATPSRQRRSQDCGPSSWPGQG